MSAEAIRHQPPSLTWRMEFTPYVKSIRLVRTQVERAMIRWGCNEEDAATAVLVCSELATNAVEHAHVPGEWFGVQVTVTGRSCLIEVSDSLSKPPRMANPTTDDEHGRGLQLVAALTDGFGHRRHIGQGKTIWARLTLRKE